MKNPNDTIFLCNNLFCARLTPASQEQTILHELFHLSNKRILDYGYVDTDLEVQNRRYIIAQNHPYYELDGFHDSSYVYLTNQQKLFNADSLAHVPFVLHGITEWKRSDLETVRGMIRNRENYGNDHELWRRVAE